MYTCYGVAFDLLIFKGHFGSFGALVPKIASTQKQLPIEKTELDLGPRGTQVSYCFFFNSNVLVSDSNHMPISNHLTLTDI